MTRVESLSPELRGKLKALLLQRPQHLIQTPCTSPCWGKRPSLGPRPKSLGWEDPRSPLTFLDQQWPSMAQTSTQDSRVRSSRGSEGRGMEEAQGPEPHEEMFLAGIVVSFTHSRSSHLHNNTGK